MIVDSRHRFTLIKLNNSPIVIHFLHNVNGKAVMSVYYDRYNIYQMDHKVKALKNIILAE